jgi:hypothetical protein
MAWKSTRHIDPEWIDRFYGDAEIVDATSGMS